MLYHSLETAFLREPGAWLVTSDQASDISMYPFPTVPAFHTATGDLNSNPHACPASTQTREAIPLTLTTQSKEHSTRRQSEALRETTPSYAGGVSAGPLPVSPRENDAPSHPQN